MTLRARLAWTYGVGLAIGMVIFAIVSIATIDRVQRAGLDSRLESAAQAAAPLAKTHGTTITVAPDDRGQFQAIFTRDVAGAIFDARGRALAQSGGRIPPAIVAATLANAEPHTFDIGSGEDALRAFVVPIENAAGATLGFSVSWRESDSIDEFERSVLLGMVAIALVILAVAAGTAWLLAGRALRPLQRMSSIATDIEAHDLSRRLNAPGADELGRLSVAFDRMLDRLEAAFTRQRRFTADASHELRAPLSVIRAEADLALRREREGDEYRKALATVAREADRLEELVEALLASSRADAGEVARSPVDICALARDVSDRLEPSARVKNIELRLVEGDAGEIPADGASLERALTAVIHNAIAWTPPDGRVTIAVGKGVVTVADTGPGFTPEGLEHATERFWRGDPSRPRGSSGLGLAIAQTLVEANAGRLSIANGIEGGARVSLTFTE
ncbi:MAG: HAMP domain-containing histidine kinase [Candidatus Eremiobacteraeota bacterium]|nr:HAMP domain-containing histidine kinase [Candidatus Eremiobacteraeota bacterium]